MNERIIKLGLESGMLNYIDNETPRHYFLCGNADEQCLEKFALLIVRESIVDFYRRYLDLESEEDITEQVNRYVKDNFGVEE